MNIRKHLSTITGNVRKKHGSGKALAFFVNNIQPIYSYFEEDEIELSDKFFINNFNEMIEAIADKERVKRILSEIRDEKFEIQNNTFLASYEDGFYACFNVVELKENKFFVEFTGTAG